MVTVEAYLKLPHYHCMLLLQVSWHERLPSAFLLWLSCSAAGHLGRVLSGMRAPVGSCNHREPLSLQ